MIGRNEAGKSALFNAITECLEPTTESVRLAGRDITGGTPDRLVCGGMGRSFQRMNVLPELTAFDDVQAALLAHHRKFRDFVTPGARLCRDEAGALPERVGLAEDAGRLTGTLAYGHRKQLESAPSIVSEPRALLLDEPTAGASPQETVDILSLVWWLPEERVLTPFFTEHDTAFVLAIATRLTVLPAGPTPRGGHARGGARRS